MPRDALHIASMHWIWIFEFVDYLDFERFCEGTTSKPSINGWKAKYSKAILHRPDSAGTETEFGDFFVFESVTHNPGTDGKPF